MGRVEALVRGRAGKGHGTRTERLIKGTLLIGQNSERTRTAGVPDPATGEGKLSTMTCHPMIGAVEVAIRGKRKRATNSSALPQGWRVRGLGVREYPPPQTPIYAERAPVIKHPSSKHPGVRQFSAHALSRLEPDRAAPAGPSEGRPVKCTYTTTRGRNAMVSRSFDAHCTARSRAECRC